MAIEKLQMVDVDFGPDVEAEVEKYIEQQLDYLERSHSDLHKNKIPKWRKQYLGIPAEEVRNFPFPNAANTVVQVIGETVDTMTARVLGLLFATHPLWVYQNFVSSRDPDEQKRLEAERRTLEDYMDIVGFEPGELDLYRIEGQWFTDAAKLGTAFVKETIEQRVENVVVGYEEAKVRVEEDEVYNGPKVGKLRHEDVLADPAAQTLDEAEFVAIRRTLKRQGLEERGFKGFYNKELVDEIIKTPDRATPREGEAEELQDQGINVASTNDYTGEWDVYECYFGWWYAKRKYSCIYSYHAKSKKVLRKIFNFMPRNRLPVTRAKLGYRTDGLYGHGYAELLEYYQEELSTTHNQRLDNATVANIRALRISPRLRSLDSNFELYPAALLVGEKDEIESIQVGDVYPSTFKNEELTLQLVARRAGISPSISGAGTGGGMPRRPAVYSAQGTMAVMQENNSQVGHATSEFRHAHVMLGAKLTEMYGRFGTNGREAMFGLDAEFLKSALKRYAEQRMGIPIRSSNASLNKEVDKQSDTIVIGLMQRHYTAVGQLMQAMNNPVVPPDVKEYFARVIVASELLHKRVLKDFGYTQPEPYVPEASLGQPQGQNQAALQGGQMAAAQSSMAGLSVPATFTGPGVLPEPGMEGA